MAYSRQTDLNAQGVNVTTLWRTIRANKEDRVAKLEWAPSGGLGRAVIGKVGRPASCYMPERTGCLTRSATEHAAHGGPGSTRPTRTGRHAASTTWYDCS